MDPPYYDNVMYAELSDFFYVWLKRTAGHVFPELFRRQLTDKDNEAVANPARFQGQKGAKALAGRDYQARMASIFAECRRTLKRFSDSPCTAWARRGTSAYTNAGGPMQAYSMDLRERALLDSDAGMKAALGTPASLATIWRAVAALDVTSKKNGPALRTRST